MNIMNIIHEPSTANELFWNISIYLLIQAQTVSASTTILSSRMQTVHAFFHRVMDDQGKNLNKMRTERSLKILNLSKIYIPYYKQHFS